jgi:hypothetical protein
MCSFCEQSCDEAHECLQNALNAATENAKSTIFNQNNFCVKNMLFLLAMPF